MVRFNTIAKLVIAGLVVFVCSCEPAVTDIEQESVNTPVPADSAYAGYEPVEIAIMPLTEFVESVNSEGTSVIKVYVSMLDSHGWQIRAPGVFRFELYTRVPLSGERKGKRVYIWPDIDLTESRDNGRYWRDFLRAYEFELDIEQEKGIDYILHVTCLCPEDKRLLADCELKVLPK